MNELELFAGAESPETHWKTPTYMRERAKAWRLANPEYIKEYKKKNRRATYITESIRRYGITKQWFEETLAKQEKSCATCSKPFDWSDKQTKPHIDHCHVTKKVRGILCNKCNTVLGLVSDKQEVLSNLSEYIKCHGQSAK